MDNDKLIKYLRDLEKLKASGVKSEDYVSPLDNEVNVVKSAAEPKEKLTKLKNMTQRIDTKSVNPQLSGDDFRNKIASLTKGGGKKVLGALPLAGAAIAALQGDPAMAAEELMEDAVGPLAALKPESAGDREAERDLMTEIQSRKDYKKSGAYRDARGLSNEDEAVEELSKPRKNKFSRLMGLFGE